MRNRRDSAYRFEGELCSNFAEIDRKFAVSSARCRISQRDLYARVFLSIYLYHARWSAKSGRKVAPVSRYSFRAICNFAHLQARDCVSRCATLELPVHHKLTEYSPGPWEVCRGFSGVYRRVINRSTGNWARSDCGDSSGVAMRKHRSDA